MKEGKINIVKQRYAVREQPSCKNAALKYVTRNIPNTYSAITFSNILCFLIW